MTTNRHRYSRLHTGLICVLLGLGYLLSATRSAEAQTYARATVGKDGRLHIVTTAGREIVIPKQPGQLDIARIAISPDRRSVGWTPEYRNGSTSYPIPHELLVHTAGKTRSFVGNELPIFAWRFEAGGTQVAFHQETVHGGFGLNDELHDLATGRLIDREQHELDRGAGPEVTTHVVGKPANDRGWIMRLNSPQPSP